MHEKPREKASGLLNLGFKMKLRIGIKDLLLQKPNTTLIDILRYQMYVKSPYFCQQCMRLGSPILLTMAT